MTRCASFLLVPLLLGTSPIHAADRVLLGMATGGAPIAALAYDAKTGAPTVLAIGKIDALKTTGLSYRMIVVEKPSPEGAALSFPPSGVAYRDNAESQVLWRYILSHPPDAIIMATSGAAPSDSVTASLTKSLDGRVPVYSSQKVLPRKIAPSPLHVEIDKRKARTPRQFADEMAAVFGHDFDQLTYIPGMALIGRMRLGATADVAKIAEPYLSVAKPALNRANSLTLAGHMVFAELAERTGDARARQLVINAANLGFDDKGVMKESMPFHDEMSDSFFMATPMVTRAGKFTGETKYYDMAARHLAFMEKLDLRADGLYRHSPLAEAAWGRGNAFTALGYALTLSEFPESHPERARILLAYQQHMSALTRFQDNEGMWHNVIDHPESFAETSATAMIATAMLRGIRRGWLDPKSYQPRVDRAWKAVLARIASDGTSMDVCESTNKQRTLDDYLHRVALFEKDPRMGGMALMFATEMAGL